MLWTLALGAGVFLLIVLLVGLAYAGSSTKLAEGTHVAGVDIGGMTKETAVAQLEEEYADVADQPVKFASLVPEIHGAAPS